MSDDALGRAIDRLSAVMRQHAAVVMVADGHDEEGSYIEVLIRRGAQVPPGIPDRVSGFRVKIEVSEEIIPYDL